MALEVYWGSGSPYAWRVLLALELKGVPYQSRLLEFSREEQRHELLAAARLVVPVQADEAPRPDPVPVEEDPCPPRVLAEHRVRRAELLEDAECHVREVPDRRRADRERHQRPFR